MEQHRAKRTENVDVLILGAGPSGLSAGYGLTKGYTSPVILEKEAACGGLMRHIKHGDFTLDVGRKELYNRIPEVNQLWQELLADDYRHYAHRIGSLYKGHIYEMSARPLGFRRGMHWGTFVTSCMDLMWHWARSSIFSPGNYEEYWHFVAGRKFSRAMAQGYWEKFRGQRWSDMPVPDAEVNKSRGESHQFHAVKKALRLASAGELHQQNEWRHPARGTGQISEALESRIVDAGGHIQLESEVTQMTWTGNCIREVVAQSPSGVTTYRPAHVISSLPIEVLWQLLFSHPSTGRNSNGLLPHRTMQSVVMVYLFADEEPLFPHAWLEVNDVELRAGRITNYAAFNGEMVPRGQTCLCVEFFCRGADSLLNASPMMLRDMALEECVKNGLINPASCYDYLAFKMQRVNAAASWRDWQSSERLKLMKDIRQFENLYHVNRPGIDKAALAGLEAANAILSGDRSEFDDRTAPEIRTPIASPALAVQS